MVILLLGGVTRGAEGGRVGGVLVREVGGGHWLDGFYVDSIGGGFYRIKKIEVVSMEI